LNVRFGTSYFSCLVGVFKAQNKRALILFGKKVGEQGRARGSNMQKAGW